MQFYLVVSLTFINSYEHEIALSLKITTLNTSTKQNKDKSN